MSMNESDEAKRQRLANRPKKLDDDTGERRADGGRGTRDPIEELRRDIKTRE